MRGGGEVEPWQWVGGLGKKIQEGWGLSCEVFRGKSTRNLYKRGIYYLCVCKLVTACMK